MNPLVTKNQIKSNKIGVLKSLWESSQQLCYVYKIKASIEFKKKIIQGILMLLASEPAELSKSLLALYMLF